MQAITDKQMAAAVKLYRTEHPSSRAVRKYTLRGSGSGVRRATCVFYRCLVATCSARWPETKRFQAQIREHSCAALEAVIARVEV